jgi:nitrogen regulatory protein PII
MPVTCAHITLVIHIALVKKLLHHLNSIGINHLYSSYGRSVLLNDTRGLTSLFKSSDLINEPVEVFYFYLPLDCEDMVMKSIIQVCHLTIPGRGSIYSKHVQLQSGKLDQVVCSIKEDKILQGSSDQNIPLFNNLTQIHCTMSKGLVDDVSRLLLHLGIVPTITNASGTGLRDKLGLLRITIPREKELLSLVIGHQEAHGVMEQMIMAGKIDRPGRGFIWQVPVQKGLINFKTSQKSIGQAASPEQIIAAIDSLKGNLLWRQGGSPLATKIKRDYFKGTEYMLQVNEGFSVAVAEKMLQLGISGATVQPLKTLIAEKVDENIAIPQEIVRVVVSPKQAQTLQDYLDQNEKVEDFFTNSHIYALNVNRAFNYKAPN